MSSLDWSVAIVSLITHYSKVTLLPSYPLLCAIWSSWMAIWYIFQKAESLWSLFYWPMVLLYIFILVCFIQNQNTPQEIALLPLKFPLLVTTFRKSILLSHMCPPSFPDLSFQALPFPRSLPSMWFPQLLLFSLFSQVWVDSLHNLAIHYIILYSFQFWFHKIL